MKNYMNFKIEDFEPIRYANINLGKINVVGGHNGAGKSTASKLLYCYLRSCYSKKEEFAINQLENKIYDLINNVYHKLDIEKPEFINSSMKKMNGNNIVLFDEADLLDKYKQASYDYSTYLQNNPPKGFIDKDFDDINEVLNKISINKDYELESTLLKSLIQFEFNYIGGISSFKGVKNNIKFNFSLNLKDSDLDKSFHGEGSFDLEDIFYIDSFSFFDSDKPIRSNNHHSGYLRNILYENDKHDYELFDSEFNKKIISIEKNIQEILEGEIALKNGKFYFNTNKGKSIEINDVASGIKQIGIVQLLLKNRKLKENTFLIIEQPEVNLHPDWQLKFAEILILLASGLNVTIYLNSHSPLFIEAIDTFSKFYNIDDETNYYLTEKSNDDCFTFNNVKSSELYKIYDNLAKAYEDINFINLKIEYESKKCKNIEKLTNK